MNPLNEFPFALTSIQWEILSLSEMLDREYYFCMRCKLYLTCHIINENHHKEVHLKGGKYYKPKIHECVPCGYKTDRKSTYIKHCKSQKHLTNTTA